jgi:asparagine synthase (glutamine-hydrolysing)
VCGIAGIVGAPAGDRLERMAAAMVHRGPDDQGIWLDGRCGLAFRRLAIIDLEERSNQPLHLGRHHLAFNGEVYNFVELRAELEGLGHTFTTEGDGEVLLHAWAQWGEGALDRLNAMFAFAVWDDEERALTLAADPFGEKPLYWRREGEALLFASDIRALGAVTPDRDALAAYVALGTLPEPDRSFYEGVYRLPAAHRLRFADGRVDVRRYWTPRAVDVPAAYEDAVRELRELLVDSIRIRLRSDVPVGTSLSGGVDSSAIVTLSAELAGDHRRHAFTARFPGFERDEWGYAHEVAQAAGVVEHHAIEPTADDLLRDVQALVRDQEEPFGSLSIYAQWRVNRCAREVGVTVLLDGQGADELFAGYPGVEDARPRRAPRWVGALARRRAASPYATAEAARTGARREPPGAEWRGDTPLQGELLRQTFASSLPALLRYADRDSMAHSREVRLPFLDRRIAEFALSPFRFAPTWRRGP